MSVKATLSANDEHNRQPDRLGERIATALDKLAGTPPAPCDFTVADAFVFLGETAGLTPVLRVNRVDIALLRGIDRARDTLLANTERFARGVAANNALLWGARGMGSLMSLLRREKWRFLIFCDDLSFDAEDTRSCARRRDRGAACKCALLCNVEPAPHPCARNDRK